jgi:hypothetical protein
MGYEDLLRNLGFDDTEREPPYRGVFSLAAREKHGKTHAACTLPGPIAYMDLDLGTEGVVEKFQRDGKQIFVHQFRLKEKAAAKTQLEWQQVWLEFQRMFWGILNALDGTGGTVVVDTETAMYDTARLAWFGKLSQVPSQFYNNCYEDLNKTISQIYDTDLNLVLLRKIVDAFQTKEDEVKGFRDTPYIAQVNLESRRIDSVDANGNPQSRFELLVVSSRFEGATLTGQKVPGADMENLLMRMHPHRNGRS